ERRGDDQQDRQQRREHRAHGRRGQRHGHTVGGRYRRGAVPSPLLPSDRTPPVIDSAPDPRTPLEIARTRAASMFRALPEEVHDLGRRFEAEGHELALVGGPVRDAVLGRSSADLECTSSARADETGAILRTGSRDGAIWDIGREFGTLCGIRDGVKVEITTYRTELYDPTSRKPQVAFGDTLDGDLSRRDFTVRSEERRVGKECRDRGAGYQQ